MRSWLSTFYPALNDFLNFPLPIENSINSTLFKSSLELYDMQAGTPWMQVINLGGKT